MLAINHMIAGAAIGLTVSNPILAAGAAVGSHFILDAMPQFGYSPEVEKRRYGSLYFKGVLIADISLTLFFLFGLAHMDRFDLLVFALLAYSPDILWIYKFVFIEKYGTRVATKPLNFFTKFHADIQVLEFPWMFWLELIAAFVSGYALFQLLG